jgi:hypothetical protein
MRAVYLSGGDAKNYSVWIFATDFGSLPLTLLAVRFCSFSRIKRK